MAFDPEDTLQRIEQLLRLVPEIDSVQLGPPLGEPVNHPFSVFYYLESYNNPQVSLAKTTEVYVVTARFYHRWINQDPKVVELRIARAISVVVEQLLGDFDLGATIRQVDVAGIYGASLSATWNNTPEATYRIVDLTIPLIVDDSATLTK